MHYVLRSQPKLARRRDRRAAQTQMQPLRWKLRSHRLRRWAGAVRASDRQLRSRTQGSQNAGVRPSFVACSLKVRAVASSLVPKCEGLTFKMPYKGTGATDSASPSMIPSALPVQWKGGASFNGLGRGVRLSLHMTSIATAASHLESQA